MSLMKRCPPGRPGGLPVLLLACAAPAAALTGGPATAAQQGTLGELAAGQGKYLGSATDNPELPDAPYAAVLGTEFGSITSGNSMKWDATETEQGRFGFTQGDAIVGFARERDQSVRGHTLAWHSQPPGWVASLPASEVEGAMIGHIGEVAGHHRGAVDAWGVVNESFNEDGTFRTSPFHTAMGPDCVATALRAVHAADPEADLYLDDYNIEGFGAKSDAMYALVGDLIDEGVPIDGVGIQGRLAIQYGFPAGLRQDLQRFADPGLDVAVMELDVRMDLPADPAKPATQATYCRRVVEACLAVERCVGITVWDYTDKYPWIPGAFPGRGAASLCDEDLRPEPAHEAVRLALGGSDGGDIPGGPKAQYESNDGSAGDSQIKPSLRLVNTGDSAVDLSTVTVRYWFTGDGGAPAYDTWCDWSPLGRGAVTHRVAGVSTPATGADLYLEVGFSGGVLSPGGSTGDTQLRLDKTDWSAFDETDDYSHGAGTSYADAPKVAVHVGGDLVRVIGP